MQKLRCVDLRHKLPDGCVLELLEMQCSNSLHSAPHPPLLFVHGANHAAWCWQVMLFDSIAGTAYHESCPAPSIGQLGRFNLSAYIFPLPHRPLRFCAVQENFLPWFAQHGHHVYAMSLRGHGGSCDQQADADKYRQSVQDIAHVVASFPEAPVLVTHSMGGFFAQRLVHLHSNDWCTCVHL